ncbi:Glycoprotein 3-alpha-L-fucosyltransferase A [Holothuria leucospilota]|uniref:Fucosyltransferase n=1 Tax=Holothuria leucospilota TaxID=206669 RepID=A0A9Q1CT85_HOLLE|nr:Glycoprotein 3-alpha-L-fucosyltransferase A [Holothuria leucospilota]
MSTPDNTARHILHKTTTKLPSIRKNYDFVAFKKKPGWHFVDFPCHYVCEEHAASVTVHFTTNASDIVGANAVFFSTGPFTLEEWEALQYYRNPGQIWIFATQEPASIVPDFLPPKVYRYNTYNWSFTFHSTSDIHGAYGWYTPYTQPPSTLHPLNWHKEKPKLAAWVSSRHCEGLGWNRTQFVIDLGKFIPIDTYGKCGNTTLRKNAAIAREQFKIYKFHLSLENSCCSEYLSEKVWNAFENWESVPIVIGGTKQEYERLAPPHSFIHADDFGSMKELADYIRKVSEDEHLYNEYFDWRNKGYVKQQSFEFRFPVFRQGVCKVVDRMEKIKREDNDMFDPYGPDWFGSCYRCGEHSWIRNYTVWWRRTIFAQDWEDNRILHWMDNETKQAVNSLSAKRLSQHKTV